MAEVKFTATAVPNGPFPIARSNELEGGLKTVESLNELNNIDSCYLTEGSLGYVKETKKYYTYINGNWVLFSQGGSGGISDGLSHTFFSKSVWDELTNNSTDFSEIDSDVLYFIYESDEDVQVWKFGDKFPIRYSN